MRFGLFHALIGISLISTFSSCYVINFSKDFEFEMVYTIKSDSVFIYESYVQDATVYESFEELVGYVESVEINSISVKLKEFNGSDDQLLSNGTLRVGNEEGSESQVLGILPDVVLKDMMESERFLELDEMGKDLAEELILSEPHICVGIMTGDLNKGPADFTLKLSFSVTVYGSML
jgi:hypothetical protein